jgi:hypothetical protein
MTLSTASHSPFIDRNTIQESDQGNVLTRSIGIRQLSCSCAWEELRDRDGATKPCSCFKRIRDKAWIKGRDPWANSWPGAAQHIAAPSIAPRSQLFCREFNARRLGMKPKRRLLRLHDCVNPQLFSGTLMFREFSKRQNERGTTNQGIRQY